VTHEVGHVMGGGHCADGQEGVRFGFPLAGYDDAGFPNAPGLMGGTAQCGNSAAFYSNPDLVLDLDQIAAFVAEGHLPDQDYVAELGAGGTLRLGDPDHANMAQTWRDNEENAATSLRVTKYPGYEDDFHADPDCAAFFSGESYQGSSFVLCSGDSQGDASTLGSVRSVQLGRNVHVNLHSDSEFGTESTCGGLWRRLAFSTP